MEPLTADAGHARTNNPVHYEAAGDVFQLFRHILAKQLQLAAALPTGVARRQDFLIAGKMTGQGLTLGLAFWRRGPIRIGIVWQGFLRGCGNLLVFQRQCQLIQSLRAGSEAMLAHPGQLVLELLDQDVAELGLARGK